jgi:hypothetical protein
MEIQTFVAQYYRELFFVAGILFLFLGIMPIVSKEYYQKNIHNDKNIWPFSKHDGYIYDRYIRQIYPILLGFTLIFFAVYQYVN